jgi:predicted HicB family RNase H-like nuclease
MGRGNSPHEFRDVIHFEGRTATALERAFRESIDSYLELCAENGQQPNLKAGPGYPRLDHP